MNDQEFEKKGERNWSILLEYSGGKTPTPEQWESIKQRIYTLDCRDMTYSDNLQREK